MAKALIVGATGLVGTQVVQKLSEENRYECIYSIQRKPLEKEYPRVQQIIIDSLDTIEEVGVDSIDDVFCCIGTTIKNAGSKEAFKKVDYDYPVKICAWAATKGAKHLLVITAMGADKKSIFFYNQMKGLLEETLSNQYLIPIVSILRPSLLLGSRKEKRPGEAFAIQLFTLLNPLFIGYLKKYKGIKASTVAQAMVQIAQHPSGNHVQIYPSDVLETIANTKFIES